MPNRKQRSYDIAEVLLSEQNFAAAVIVGAVATVLAAAIYGVVVARWNFSYGFAAAVYTIAGCLLGNVFTVVSPLNLFGNNDFAQIAGRSVSYLSFVHLVFWFVAVFAAVFLARRPLSRSDRLAIGMYDLKG